MSESPPSGFAGDITVERASALTSEQVETILADFKTWLNSLSVLPDDEAADSDEGPDLYSLLEQLTALRHEVNLQTRATRAQQEQNAATLTRLSQALDSNEPGRTGAGTEREEVLRPLLKTLVELYDALAVAGREVQRVQDVVLPALQQSIAGAPGVPPEPPVVPELSLLARWFGARDGGLAAYRESLVAWRKRIIEEIDQPQQSIARLRQLLASLGTGYTMGLQRIERALKQHGLQAVVAAGQPFDPERMEAIEAVTESGQPVGQVLDEIQRGYLWNGRVFRYARVRVAK